MGLDPEVVTMVNLDTFVVVTTPGTVQAFAGHVFSTVLLATVKPENIHPTPSTPSNSKCFDYGYQKTMYTNSR